MSLISKLEHLDVALKVKVAQFETTVSEMNRALDELHLIQVEVSNIIAEYEDESELESESDVPCRHPRKLTGIDEDGAHITHCADCMLLLKYELS